MPFACQGTGTKTTANSTKEDGDGFNGSEFGLVDG